MNAAGSLLYGIGNLLHPRMLWLMIWPMLIAVAIWGTVAVALWTRTAIWLAGVLSKWLEPAAAFVHFDFADAAMIAAQVLLFLLFVPLVYLTALFILGVFGMQKMVDYVASRSFPGLERRHGGGTTSSVWNGVVALLGMAGLLIVSIPLWFIPPLWPLIPLVILAWGNQRLLRHDALCEHADRKEMAQIFSERRGGMYLLGLLMAISAYVPLAGFAAPVVFGLAYIRYLLGALQEIRRAQVGPA
jgi:CysZ protein